MGWRERRAAKRAARAAEAEAAKQKAIAAQQAAEQAPKPPGCPVLDRYGRPAGIENLFQGGHVFLILGGPSYNTLNHDLLKARGVVTFGVNNVAAHVRPNLWTYGDTTAKFHDAIWKDPHICKLAPYAKFDDRIREKLPDGTFRTLNLTPRQCPNTLGIHRNSIFDPEKWLFEGTINWGLGKDGVVHYLRPWLEENLGLDPKASPKQAKNVYEQWLKEGKIPPGHIEKHCPCPKVLSTMIQAVRLCYYLGFRHVYLLGCDFTMTQEAKYSFPESGNPGTVNNNTNSYAAMKKLFKKLRPEFDKAGFEVLNCNPNSGLTAFDYLPFEQCVGRATKDLPRKIDTDGWYIKQK